MHVVRNIAHAGAKNELSKAGASELTKATLPDKTTQLAYPFNNRFSTPGLPADKFDMHLDS